MIFPLQFTADTGPKNTTIKKNAWGCLFVVYLVVYLACKYYSEITEKVLAWAYKKGVYKARVYKEKSIQSMPD